MKTLPTVLLLSLVVISLPSCEKIKQVHERREAAREMKEASSHMADNFKMTDEGLVVDHAGLAARQEAIAKSADKMGGKLGEAVKVTTTMNGENAQIAKDIDEWTQRFVSTLNWQELRKNNDYEIKRKLLKEFQEFNKGVIEHYRQYPKQLSKRLDDIGFEGGDRKEFESGVLIQINKITPFIQVIREADIECADIALGMIDRLEKIDDQWKWNDALNQIQFDKDEDVDWFNQAVAKFTPVAERQKSAQMELINSIKKP